MTLAYAVSKRIRKILAEKKMTQYRLEQNAGISHSTMNCFLNARYKACNLTTVVLIIRALGMTIAEFFDDPIFESDDLMVEWTNIII